MIQLVSSASQLLSLLFLLLPNSSDARISLTNFSFTIASSSAWLSNSARAVSISDIFPDTADLISFRVVVTLAIVKWMILVVVASLVVATVVTPDDGT